MRSDYEKMVFLPKTMEHNRKTADLDRWNPHPSTRLVDLINAPLVNGQESAYEKERKAKKEEKGRPC